jgi:DNA-binding CsgD family transcriptional regulator
LVLHGRTAERSLIAGLLDGARASHSGVLVIRGSPGIGKSALLHEAADVAPDVRILTARGSESEMELAFAGLHQLLRPVLDRVDRLPPHHGSALRRALGFEAGAGDDRFLVAVAVLGLLAEAADESPLLCLIDDAQWLDESSAATLLFVARRLEAERVVVLFAARDDDDPGFSAVGLPELRLAGLDARAAAGLLDERVGDEVVGEVRDWLVGQTAGNPLALLEIPAGLSADQLVGRAPLPAVPPLSEGLERLFADRAGGLPRPTRTALLVSAAEETAPLATVLRAAAALGADAAALDPAEQAGLVRVRGGHLTFRHPLVRSAVYQAATTSERRAAHHALACVLGDEGDADRHAWHLAAAAPGPDESVVRELDAVAERARARGGFAAAAAALERAAELTVDRGARGRRLISAADNAWSAGRLGHVARLLATAHPLATDPVLRADLGQLRAWFELSTGSAPAAVRILLDAVEDAAPVDARRARRMLAACAEAAWLLGEEEAGREIRRLAGTIGPVTCDVDGHIGDLVAGFLRLLDGDLRPGLDLLAETIARAERLDEPMVLISAGHHAFYVGDDAAAYRINARIVARARATGDVANVLFALPRLVQAELVLGRWTAAAAGAAESVRLARETGQLALAAPPLTWLALLAALRGDDESAEAHLAEAERFAPQELGIFATSVRDVGAWVRAAQKMADGRPASAAMHLEHLEHPVIADLAMLDRIEAASLAGRELEARRWLDRVDALAGHPGREWANARAAHCHGLLATGTDAPARFKEALDHHRLSGRPFERARTELAYGKLLRRIRRRADARAHLTAALDAFEALAAAPWAERAQAELRACGQSARRRDPSATRQLTPQEVQVARFVARGLPTRQVAEQLFLSPRTIDYHLRNVFAKLGISSRAELAGVPLD